MNSQQKEATRKELTKELENVRNAMNEIENADNGWDKWNELADQEWEIEHKLEWLDKNPVHAGSYR